MSSHSVSSISQVKLFLEELHAIKRKIRGKNIRTKMHAN